MAKMARVFYMFNNPMLQKNMYVFKDLIVHTYNVTAMSLSCCSSMINLCNLNIFLF